MKKTLLIVLACLLCFFAGYFVNSKLKNKNIRYTNPYSRPNIARQIASPRIPKPPIKLQVVNKLPDRPNVLPKTSTPIKNISGKIDKPAGITSK